MALLRRAATIAVLLAAFLAAGQVRAQSSGQGSLEAAIKATLLYKFGPFVEWPPGRFASTDTPVSLCVLGEDPFHGVLDQAVGSRPAEDRPIVLRRLTTLTGPPVPCDIVFVAGSTTESRAQMLATIGRTPVLTVTDGATDPTATGIINFVVAQNKVRFQIDEAAAKRAGLDISSKLLSLAVSVRQ